MIIQGTMTNVMNIPSKPIQNRKFNQNNKYDNDFSSILDTKSKQVNYNESKTRSDRKTLSESSDIKSINRKISIKEENNFNEKQDLKKGEESKNKKEKVIEELLQNINNILAMIQSVEEINFEDVEGLELESINLKMSAEELGFLKDSLKDALKSVELKEEKLLINEILESIENSQSEIDAKKLISDLKQVISAIESEEANGGLLQQANNSSKELQQVTIDKSDNTDIELKDVDKFEVDVKVKVNVKDKDNKGQNIKANEKPEDIEVKIEDKSNINNITSNVTDNRDNNEHINYQISQSTDTKMPLDIEKSILSNQQYLNIDENDVIKQIANKFKSDYNSEINEIKIKLSPEHLGNLTIKVTLERGIITAKALVENLNVKQMLESNVNQLKESLKQQGITFESIDVSVGEDSNNEQGNSQAFTQNKKLKIPKLKIDNSMNLYEDIEDELKGQNSSIGEGGLDISI